MYTLGAGRIFIKSIIIVLIEFVYMYTLGAGRIFIKSIIIVLIESNGLEG